MEIRAHNGQLVTVNTRTSAKAQRYQRLAEATRSLLQSTKAEDKAKVARANAAMRQKFMSAGAVHVDAVLSNISVQYANEAYIGIELLPPVQVDKLSGDYFIYDRRNRMAYPDDQMNQRSRANEISESRSLDNYSCRPYGLQDYVDLDTLDNQDAPLDEMVDATEATAEGIAFRREKRIAGILTNASLYTSTNKLTLVTGSTSWKNGQGDPLTTMQTARSSLWSGRGPSKIIAAADIDTWSALSAHPRMLDLFKYGGTRPGLMTPDMFASFFRVDEFLIAEARQDTANEGQAPAYGRIWPNFFWMGRVATSPSRRNAGFGCTFRCGPVRTIEWFDPAVGTQGGNYVKVTTKEDHKVQAPDAAYLVSSPLA